MSETLRDVAVDLAGQLASCEANAAYDGLDSWEHRSEYFGEYMDRINAADAERTCHDVDDRTCFECSACGATLDLSLGDCGEPPLFGGDGRAEEPRFCPMCGARVVSDVGPRHDKGVRYVPEKTCKMAEHNDLQSRGWYIHYWECSDCHAHYRDKDKPRFCPNCGARVEGGQS